MASGRIVVGVDGSRSSQDALRWAVTEARLRGTTVKAVHVWRYPLAPYAPGMAVPVVPNVDFEADARAVLDQAVDAAVAEDDDGPAVERLVLEGAAAERLVQRARRAELLVVGHRGRGGFAGLLLGSVAQQCSAHASCPVVVVREADDHHRT